MTSNQKLTLQHFRGTGSHVGKDQFHKDKLPPRGVGLKTLLSLRRLGMLEHFIANRWYLTEKGREFVYGWRKAA